MTEKIMQALKLAQDKLCQLRISTGPMKYVFWFAVIVVICCGLYIAGWCAEWYLDGRPNLPEMRLFLGVITSSAWVAAMAFIAKMLVDKDKDGIPDELEKEDEK